jgi:DNA polymerase III alpha subunit (gram-positive type)
MREYVIIYDLETTGRDQQTAAPVQVAALLKYGRRKVQPVMNTYVNPNQEISKEASEVHGITQSVVQSYPPAEVAMFMLESYIECLNAEVIIAGHNHISYDNVVAVRSGWEEVLKYGQIDTLRIARRLMPDSATHQLSDLYEIITGDKLTDAHDAMADIKAVSVLIDEFMDKLGFGTYSELAKYCETPQPWQIMPISKKHKGKHVSQVPMNFWLWMCKNTDMFYQDCDFRATIELVAPELYEEMVERE